MKSNTPELMKFKRLQRRLGDSRRGIIGLLEGLWLETAKNAPQGDIGRFTNEEIAIMCDWPGDADELIDSLVECRWLDTCETHRLVVHDWDQHCPTYVKGQLARQKKPFACPTNRVTIRDAETGDETALNIIQGCDFAQDQSSIESFSKEPTIEAYSEYDSTKPNLTKPNQVRECPSDGSLEVDTSSKAVTSPQDVVDIWNLRARSHSNLKEVRALTNDRRAKLAKRLASQDWPWREAIEKLPLPPGPNSDWQPDLDYLIRNETNAVKIVEGAFDWRARNGKNSNFISPEKPRSQLTPIETRD